ncbi:TlpA family protein disulfide reductase [Catenulispora rubra]|uniref:TlpA family protein disulfide reductase n=1 Tax=Catenulispora rubra TaxID=280293 RepID=UPI001891FA20|nr:TlpA disulfide reductase family protein [Catenulispora rubra]
MFASLAALTLLATGCSNNTSSNSATGQATVISPAKRADFPQLSGPTLDGPTLSLTPLSGRVIVVNVWGSWCLPCQHEAPDLERAYEAYRNIGVSFVGIDTRDNAAQAKSFIATSRIEYPNLIDDGSEKLLTKLAGIVPLQAVPSTVIVDRTGKVAWTAPMPIDYKTLAAGLDAILSEKQTP